MADLIMDLTGVDKDTAEAALKTHGEVWLAVDSLLVKPVVSGEKYIPAKREVDSGLSSEQQSRCKRGRWLQEKVNVVFSVAHSQTLHPQGDLQEVASVELPQLDDQVVPVRSASPSPPLDADGKMTQ
jgi:hypothetical protein